ncbi:colicin-like pore-forming protein [Enterobacter sp. 638]|nr:colicin-like pore-forming protein [Enterobacter sp. 638]
MSEDTINVDGPSGGNNTGHGNGTGGSGNSGSKDNSHNSGTSAQNAQVSAVFNDPVVRKKIVALKKGALLMNPNAKVEVLGLTSAGMINVSITGLNAYQASTLGVTGLLSLRPSNGSVYTFGEIPTGHKLSGANSNSKDLPGSVLNGLIDKAVNEDNKNNAPPTLAERVAKFYRDRPSQQGLTNLYKETLKTGKIPKAARGNLLTNLNKLLEEDKKNAQAAAKAKVDEGSILQKTGEIIAGVGEEISKHAAVQFKNHANKIANDLKNFQGKKIRSFNDATTSLNKIASNSSSKMSAADKSAIVNALKHANVQALASNLDNLSLAFKGVDKTLLAGKIIDKIRVGYETGNWGPLILEIESSALSALTTAAGLAIVAYSAPFIAATVGLPVTAITVAGIIAVGIVASLIDENVATAINNELIKPAH